MGTTKVGTGKIQAPKAPAKAPAKTPAKAPAAKAPVTYGPPRAPEHRLAGPSLAWMPGLLNLRAVAVPASTAVKPRMPAYAKNQQRAARFDLARPGAAPKPKGPVNYHVDKTLAMQHKAHAYSAYAEIGEAGTLLGLRTGIWHARRSGEVAKALGNVPKVVRMTGRVSRFEHVIHGIHHYGGKLFKVVNVVAKVQGVVGVGKGLEMACDPRVSHGAAAKQMVSSGLSLLGPVGALGSLVVDAIGPSDAEEMKTRRAHLRSKGINFEGAPIRYESPELKKAKLEASKADWAKELRMVGARDAREARQLVDEWAATNYRLNGGEIRAGGLLGTEPRVAVPTEAERAEIVARFEREAAAHH